MYSLAAQYLGMRFLYLEAGSGAARNVSCEMIAAVRKQYEGVIIVGGGIHSPQTAKEMADAGADIIVIGTMLEKGDWEQNFSSIVNSLRQ
jgi:phosphoglycerol geranylgeranyltransferase